MRSSPLGAGEGWAYSPANRPMIGVSLPCMKGKLLTASQEVTLSNSRMFPIENNFPDVLSETDVGVDQDACKGDRTC